MIGKDMTHAILLIVFYILGYYTAKWIVED